MLIQRSRRVVNEGQLAPSDDDTDADADDGTCASALSRVLAADPPHVVHSR